MARTALGILVVCVMVAASATATASNYYLTDLGRFDTAQVVKFRDAGVQTTEQVLESSLTEKARKLLSAKVGLTEAQVLALAQDCELMQINGVGPKAVTLLRAGGVKSVADLAGRKAADLLPLLAAANKREGFTDTDPSLDLVQYWIEEAKRVPYHLK